MKLCSRGHTVASLQDVVVLATGVRCAQCVADANAEARAAHPPDPARKAAGYAKRVQPARRCRIMCSQGHWLAPGAPDRVVDGRGAVSCRTCTQRYRRTPHARALVRERVRRHRQRHA